jgi:hypothetical protein
MHQRRHATVAFAQQYKCLHATPLINTLKKPLDKRVLIEGFIDVRFTAMKEHSAGTWSRSAIWPRPTAHLRKMVGGNRPVSVSQPCKSRSRKLPSVVTIVRFEEARDLPAPHLDRGPVNNQREIGAERRISDQALAGR